MDFLDEMSGTQKLLLACAVLVLVVLATVYFMKPRSHTVGSQGMIVQGPPPPRPQAPPPPPPPRQGGDLVCFKADFCGHCKTLEPVFREFATNYDGMNGVRIITIDGQQNPELMKLHGLSGFPSIKYCPNGVNQPDGIVYQGDRSLPSLVDFLKQVS
jgi:thiol-disulfide isomerase/thioredoxin